MKVITLKTLCLLALTAAPLCATVQAPEIDASTGATALTLLAGGILVLRSRKR